MYCAGNRNSCQQVCEGIGKCKEGCENSELSNELKNYQDMHLCQVRFCEGLLSCYLVKPFELFILGSFQLLRVIYIGPLPVTVDYLYRAPFCHCGLFI